MLDAPPLPLLDLPEPSLLRLVSSEGQTAVSFGRKGLLCFARDDVGMRNMAVVALTDAGVQGRQVASAFGLSAEYVRSFDALADYHADVNPDTTKITNPARIAARNACRRPGRPRRRRTRPGPTAGLREVAGRGAPETPRHVVRARAEGCRQLRDRSRRDGVCRMADATQSASDTLWRRAVVGTIFIATCSSSRCPPKTRASLPVCIGSSDFSVNRPRSENTLLEACRGYRLARRR